MQKEIELPPPIPRPSLYIYTTETPLNGHFSSNKITECTFDTKCIKPDHTFFSKVHKQVSSLKEYQRRISSRDLAFSIEKSKNWVVDECKICYDYTRTLKVCENCKESFCEKCICFVQTCPFCSNPITKML